MNCPQHDFPSPTLLEAGDSSTAMPENMRFSYGIHVTDFIDRGLNWKFAASNLA